MPLRFLTSKFLQLMFLKWFPDKIKEVAYLYTDVEKIIPGLIIIPDRR